MRRQTTDWEKMFAKGISDKGLYYPKYSTELLKLNKKTNMPIKKQAKDLNRHLTSSDIQMTKEHMKRCSTSFVISGMQIKTKIRYHHTPFRMAKSRTLTTPNAGGHVEQRELSFIAGGNAKWYSHLKGSLTVYSKLNVFLP